MEVTRAALPRLKSQSHPTCTAGVFTIARGWRQPTCPLTDKWTNKMWYTRSGVLRSLEREAHSDTSDNMKEPRRHYVGRNKAVTKEHKQNERWLPGVGEREQWGVVAQWVQIQLYKAKRALKITQHECT